MSLAEIDRVLAPAWPADPRVEAAAPRAARRAGAVLADYLALTKPRIGVMVAAAAAAAAWTAAWGHPDPSVMPGLLLGVLAVGGSASVFNQWWERARDQRMPRTAERPVAAGRVAPAAALAFAGVLLAVGLGLLALGANPASALVALGVWLCYGLAYTPLKPVSPWNTAVGAVAGAGPIAIGWTAAGAGWDVRGAALFLLLFLWQFPHFMAIAWLYRRQYARAGHRMLTVEDPSGRRAGVQAVLAALALLPVSFLPALRAPGEAWYVCVAFALGLGQLLAAGWFCAARDDASARWLLRASLVYLPVLFAALAWANG